MLSRAAAVVLVTFAALNFAAWSLVEAYGLAQQPIEIQSRAAYQARLSAFFRQPARARAVVMGDSLVFGRQLEATHGASWPEHTLSARIAAARREPRLSALNLGINGVLFSELRCMVRDVLEQRPELLLINLSPRPFSADFRVPVARTERAFLCPAASDGRARLNELASSLSRRVVPALRDRDLIQFAWLGATPRERVLTSLDAWLAGFGRSAATVDEHEEEAELAEVMREMAWRAKAAARYDSIRVSQDHPQATELAGLLRLLTAQGSTRVVVFYLKENTAPLANQLDLAHYQRESAAFAELVQRQLAGSSVRFLIVPSEPLADHFIDHIHLDAQGYELLARTLLQAVPR